MNRSYRIASTCLLTYLFCLAGTSARADLSWTVTLDTSPLAGDYTGPFGLDFELIGSGGNTVTLSQFSFGGGSAGPGSAFLTGGVSGDLGGSVVLNDATGFLNDFNQQFTPGGTLSFTVDSTLVPPPSGGFPDNFSMVIFYAYDPTNGYDPAGGPAPPLIPTQDPTGLDTFLTIDVNGSGSTTAVGYSSADGSIPITVTQINAVPEPSSALMMLFGVLGSAGARLWRRLPAR
jgi:hypothetical protein